MTELCALSGKFRHPTRAAAIAAREITRRTLRAPKRGREFPQHLYQCHACHGWHLTKVDQAKANKRQR